MPTFDRSVHASAEGLTRGVYVLNARTEAPRRRDIILIATGSEVQLIVAAEPVLAGKGITARLVSNNERLTALFVSDGHAQRVEN